MSSTNNIKFQINRVDSGGMEMVITMNAIIAHNDLNENCITDVRIEMNILHLSSATVPVLQILHATNNNMKTLFELTELLIK